MRGNDVCDLAVIGPYVGCQGRVKSQSRKYLNHISVVQNDKDINKNTVKHPISQGSKASAMLALYWLGVRSIANLAVSHTTRAHHFPLSHLLDFLLAGGNTCLQSGWWSVQTKQLWLKKFRADMAWLVKSAKIVPSDGALQSKMPMPVRSTMQQIETIMEIFARWVCFEQFLNNALFFIRKISCLYIDPCCWQTCKSPHGGMTENLFFYYIQHTMTSWSCETLNRLPLYVWNKITGQFWIPCQI